MNRPSQAPEDAEIRAQEEVRTKDEESPEEQDPGQDRIQEAMNTAAEVAEKTGGLGTPGLPVNRRSPFMIGLTGALHVDGFCDLCDGLFGGQTAEERLRIMKDPHLGTFGLPSKFDTEPAH